MVSVRHVSARRAKSSARIVLCLFNVSFWQAIAFCHNIALLHIRCCGFECHVVFLSSALSPRCTLRSSYGSYRRSLYTCCLTLPVLSQTREYVSTRSGSPQVLLHDQNMIHLRHDGIGYRHEDFITDCCICLLEWPALLPCF
jgi:hypothetical protein